MSYDTVIISMQKKFKNLKTENIPLGFLVLEQFVNQNLGEKVAKVQNPGRIFSILRFLNFFGLFVIMTYKKMKQLYFREKCKMILPVSFLLLFAILYLEFLRHDQQNLLALFLLN